MIPEKRITDRYVSKIASDARWARGVSIAHWALEGGLFLIAVGHSIGTRSVSPLFLTVGMETGPLMWSLQNAKRKGDHELQVLQKFGRPQRAPVA